MDNGTVTCKVDGCDEPKWRARGLCKMHYARWNKTGDVGEAAARYAKPDATLAERMAHTGWDVTPNECWEWRGSRRPTGYGVVSIGRQKLEYTHRVAWILANGPIPPDMFICHRCDNPPCCNPAHLFLGTKYDNVADMVSKDRQCRGERQANAKLTEQAVLEIRARAGEVPVSVLAAEYGVSESWIKQIIAGTAWRHLAA